MIATDIPLPCPGKSTLLRALSRREVSIPTHISILHVEQEVCQLHPLRWMIADNEQIAGDDTPALQAVLDADVWRKHLLREQDVCFSVLVVM